MKKILTVGYYADFSKFFSDIKKELLKLSSDYDFLHINLYLSGYLYSLIHDQRSAYLPFSAHRIKEKRELISPSKLTPFIQYHLRLNPDIDPRKLIEQASKYYHYFERLLNCYSPDLIILSGDSRMPVEILQYLANERSIKTYHFEQAPLGHTILDSNGVNANCSCRNINFIDLDHINEHEEISCFKAMKWKGYKKYRIIDLFVEKFFPFLQAIEHIRPKRQVVDSKLYQKVLSRKFKNQDAKFNKLYLLVLQVPDDVNMIYHSPYFKNHFEIVRSVHSSLPEGSMLIVREHPLFRKLYESEIYTYICNNKNIYFDTSSSLGDSMSSADVVIVNNSTVGLEAIEIGKPVVILGNAYYDQFPLCYKYNGDNLSDLLDNAASVPNENDLILRKKYLVYLFNYYFIGGHFRDEKGIAPANIAKWIHRNVH